MPEFVPELDSLAFAGLGPELHAGFAQDGLMANVHYSQLRQLLDATRESARRHDRPTVGQCAPSKRLWFFRTVAMAFH